MRWSVGVNSSSNGASAFLQIEDKTVGRVAVQVISVELLAAEEAKALVEFHRGGIGDLGFEGDLKTRRTLISKREKGEIGNNLPHPRRAQSWRRSPSALASSQSRGPGTPRSQPA